MQHVPEKQGYRKVVYLCDVKNDNNNYGVHFHNLSKCNIYYLAMWLLAFYYLNILLLNEIKAKASRYVFKNNNFKLQSWLQEFPLLRLSDMTWWPEHAACVCVTQTQRRALRPADHRLITARGRQVDRQTHAQPRSRGNYVPRPGSGQSSFCLITALPVLS